MQTVRRLIHRELLQAVAFVSVAFLALFFFIDFIDQLERVGRDGRYSAGQALIYCLLLLPGHLYELLPIGLLIGGIYSMARLAQSSEFTILRTSGLGPGRALSLLVSIGLAFTAVTFVIGDYVAPHANRYAEQFKAQARGTAFGRSGAWLKDRRGTSEGERTYSIQIQSATPDGELRDVRLYEFDAQGRLLSRTTAAQAQIDDDAVWRLRDAVVTDWQPATDAEHRPGELVVRERRVAELVWQSSLTPSVVAAAVQPPDMMSTLDLYRYATHLADNEQSAQRYEIQFWRKALYPFACLVMAALALPFAYLHARSGGISLKVFGGIMLGISFVLLNNVASHVGLLQNWTPWVAAATPSVLYLLLSLLAFQWLVRYR
ncbi:LPS export ABC transporter permease LptG [Caldimonas aquatica]|uniref:LPS export ABC transporter permease LptG n=2 Tax=Pseudomonadota TaxID=1224 RepID=A0ABY6MWA9_9BURK|nr:LPS export ABC transporter permease LptG [Schlegelella aquatica]UZD56298.1 LPS export ABC transporter permease LptG [Schlegelella aquatica]